MAGGASEYLSPGHDSVTHDNVTGDAPNLPLGTESSESAAWTSNGAAAGQVLQLGAAPALNSLLHGNSSSQMAVDWYFLALAGGSDSSALVSKETDEQVGQWLGLADGTVALDQLFAHLVDQSEA